MPEQYNHIFVFGYPLPAAGIARILADGVSPGWEVLGRPTQLMKLNVGQGIEQQTNVSGRIDESLLQGSPGTIFSVRGVESGLGTVQYYELGRYGAVSISRPLRLLSPRQRLDWMNLLWSRLRPAGAIFAVSGREAEIQASDVEVVIRDSTALRRIPLLELAVLSDSLVCGSHLGSTPVDHGVLIRLQPDDSGGAGTH